MGKVELTCERCGRTFRVSSYYVQRGQRFCSLRCSGNAGAGSAVAVLTTCPGLVCDPFCGSGTTGQVAVEEGRRFLGFELSPKYVEMSKRRIGGAQAPLPIADLQP